VCVCHNSSHCHCSQCQTWRSPTHYWCKCKRFILVTLYCVIDPVVFEIDARNLMFVDLCVNENSHCQLVEQFVPKVEHLDTACFFCVAGHNSLESL